MASAKRRRSWNMMGSLSQDPPEVVAKGEECGQRLSIQETIAASERNFEQMNVWNERYDGKVATVLTLATTMLGGLGALAATINLYNACGSVSLLTLAVAVVPPLLVVFEVSRGTQPTLKLVREPVPHQPQSSLLFFGSIAARSAAQFNKDVCTRTPEGYLADLVSEQHTLASLLSTKFTHLGLAYRYLWISYAVFVPASLTLLVLAQRQNDPAAQSECAWVMRSVTSVFLPGSWQWSHPPAGK